jgi:hypothetical protein
MFPGFIACPWWNTGEAMKSSINHENLLLGKNFSPTLAVFRATPVDLRRRQGSEPSPDTNLNLGKLV